MANTATALASSDNLLPPLLMSVVEKGSSQAPRQSCLGSTLAAFPATWDQDAIFGFGSHLMAKDEGGSFKVEFYTVLTVPGQPSQLHSDALGTKAVLKCQSGKPQV